VCVRFTGKLTVDMIERYATALRNDSGDSAWSEMVDLQRHSARMQQILRSPFKAIGIFDTMAEAEAWVRSPVRQAPVPGGQLLPFPSRIRPYRSSS
jgi:hypothetical protein